jgi:hypothetical protein
MVYTYYLYEYQKKHAEILSLLDVLGIQVNPQILWNAIPWSFAIDWVIGVNQWLGKLAFGNMTPVTIIHRYCWSIKFVRRIQCFVHMSENNPYDSGPVLSRTADEEFYMRMPHQPNLALALQTSGLNPKEFSYIGALIGARL